MKNIIKAEPENKEEVDFILTDEGFDNPNFISLKLEDTWYDVSVSDLHYALMPFVAKMLDSRKD